MDESELVPFEISFECPKCGNLPAKVEYFWAEAATVNRKGTATFPAYPERLKCECEKCGYFWLMKCKDAQGC